MTPSAVPSQLIDVVFETLRAHVDAMSAEDQIAFSEKILSLSPTSSPGSPAGLDTPSNTVHAEEVMVKSHRRKLDRSKDKKDRGKKPVNAFMTFRALISPLLGKIPQKSRSPMLSLLWRAERRQAQFNILGAAYSKIRDECSNCPPLDKFLAIATEAVSVIPADQYLKLSGWELIDGILTSATVNEAEVLAAFPLNTNLSPQDIIQYCFDHGLISAMPQMTASASPLPRSDMSFAALPQNHDLMQPASPSPAAQGLDEAEPFFNFNDVATTSYSPSIEHVTQDQQNAYLNSPAALQWHPDILPPLLGFEPNAVQDTFDPFSFTFDDFTGF